MKVLPGMLLTAYQTYVIDCTPNSQGLSRPGAALVSVGLPLGPHRAIVPGIEGGYLISTVGEPFLLGSRWCLFG